MTDLVRRALLATLALPRLALAEDVPTLRVALIDVPPFGFERPDGAPDGLFVQRLTALQETLPLRFAPILLPYRRASRAVATGEADLVPVLPSRWLAPEAQLLGPFLRLSVVALVRPGLEFKAPIDWSQYKVASIRGLAEVLGDPTVKARDEVLVSRSSQLVMMLKAGRVDVVIGVAETLSPAVQQDQWGREAPQMVLLKEQAVNLYSRPFLSADIASALRSRLRSVRT